MKICIVGQSNAGKTTLAHILNRITGIEIISGDNYITETEDNIDDLSSVLGDMESYIFDHISSVRLAFDLDQVPTFVIFLILPDTVTNLRSSYVRAMKILDDHAVSYIKGVSVAEVLPHCLKYLSKEGLYPVPVTSFVVKVASRCNLNCTYCYMYEGGYDKSWKSQPYYMTPEIAERTAQQISSYVSQHSNNKFYIAFHGGEPLLLKVGEFAQIATRFKKQLAGVTNVKFSVQTNGTLVTDEYLTMLNQYGFSIGISIDGDEFANRRRLNLAGKSSFEKTLAGLKKCIAFPFSETLGLGVLSVINPMSDGAKVYQFFRQLGLKAFDFLLPDITVDSLINPQVCEGYRNFLITAFDSWLADPEPCSVPFFESTIAGIFNYPKSVDTLSLLPPSTLSVSVSGDWELLDVLRVTESNAWTTGFNVNNHSVEDVIASQRYVNSSDAKYDLSEKCLGCRHLLVCGGGHITHRYSSKSGFKNPSAHCDVLLSYFDHVRFRVQAEFNKT